MTNVNFDEINIVQFVDVLSGCTLMQTVDLRFSKHSNEQEAAIC
jgi:hypothetical protein